MQFSLSSAGSQKRWVIATVNLVTIGRLRLSTPSPYTYNKTPRSYRKWCKTCGGHLFTEQPGMGLTDVYATAIPDFPYRPSIHINYQERVLRIKDGLPKMKDLPKEMGGSGVSVEE